MTMPSIRLLCMNLIKSFLFILVSTLSYADELILNNSIELLVGQRIANNDKSDNSSDVEKSALIVTNEIEKAFDNGSQLTAIIDIKHENIKELNSSSINKSNYSSMSRPYFYNDSSQVELREFYLEQTLGNAYITLGKQQIVWGKADGLKVLDVVNPQTFTEFILADNEKSRIPLWSINIEFPVTDNTDMQLLWIPDTTTHVLPNTESKFAFTTPRLAPQIETLLSEGNINNLVFMPLKAPNLSLKNSDLGLRWSGFINGWDFTVNYLYHFGDLPVFYQTINPQRTLTITPEYKRSHLLGATFSNTFGDFTLRSEIGFSTDKYALIKPLDTFEDYLLQQGISKFKELTYVIGLDWYGLSETLISMQFFQSNVLDNQALLTRPKHDTNVTFLLQKEYLNNTLKTEILMIKNLNEHDGLLQPQITYQWSDNTKVWLAGDIFFGDQIGLFGQYKHNDRLLLGLQYDF